MKKLFELLKMGVAWVITIPTAFGLFLLVGRKNLPAMLQLLAFVIKCTRNGKVITELNLSQQSTR